MALCTFGQERLPPPGLTEGIVGTPSGRQSLRMSQSQPSGMEMGFVTLKTEEGFVLLEQIVGHRAMGIVTDGAVFEHRCVFEDERALFIPMTAEAEVVEPFGRLQVVHQRAVVLMTTAARHFSLSQRMTGRKIGFDPHFGMTVETKLGIGFFQTILIMDIMTVRAADFIECMVS